MRPLTVAFVGAVAGTGPSSAWRSSLGPRSLPPPTSRYWKVERLAARLGNALWVLRGVTSNERYVSRVEHDALVSRQEPLGRPGSTRAALIPIKKSETWWELAQDERCRIFEESSHHVASGLEYLPAVARRLHHGRDLGEPFDFLTWFEFTPGDAAGFEELVQRLRATEEWTYVEREVDMRLARRGDSLH